MEGSNHVLYESIPRFMKDSCNALKSRINKYAGIKLITLSPNPKDKYIGENCIRDYISRVQYDSFSLSAPGVLTKIRGYSTKAVECTSKRLDLSQDTLFTIIGRLNILSEESIDPLSLPLVWHEPPQETVRRRSPSPPASPTLLSGSAAAGEKFPPEDINADIKDLLEQIESLVFYDCLKLYYDNSR